MTGRSRVRWGRWVGLAAFLLALAATPVLWGELDRWVLAQRAGLWRQVEAAVGHPVAYDRIGPSVLSALDFQNVRLERDDGSPFVSAASIRLSLDWEKVFQGQFSSAVRRVQVFNASVNFDARRDLPLLDRWVRFFEAPATPLPRLEVEGFNVGGRWTDGTRSLTLDRAFVVVVFDHGRWDLSYRGAVAGQAPGGEGSLNVRGELQADEGFLNLSARASVSRLHTTWFDAEPLTVQVSVSPREVKITKVADQVPLDLQALWDRTQDRWTLRGAAEGFVPGSLVHGNHQPAWASWAQGRFSGSFSFQPGGDLAVTGRAVWPAGVLGAPLDRGEVTAEGAVRTEGALYRFEGFRLAAEGADLGFTGTVDSRTLLPDGEVEVGRWVLPGVGTAQGRLQLVRDGDRVNFLGSGVRWNGLGSASPSGWVERRGGLWSFAVDGPWDGASGGLFHAEGAWEPRGSRLTAATRIEGLPVSLAVAELAVHFPDLDAPREVKDLVADLSARFDWSPARLSVSEGSFSFRDPANPGRLARGTVVVDAAALRVTLDALEWDGFHAQGQGTALFQPTGVDWTLGVAALGRTLSLQGRWDDAGGLLTFSGTPALQGSLRRGAGAWTGEVTVEPYEVAPGWSLGLHLTGRFDGARWTVEGDRVDVTGRYPWNQQAFRAHSTLVADADFLRLGDVVVTDARGTLVGNLVSTWSFDFGQPWSGRAVLTTPDTSRETAEALWTVTDPAHASVTVRGTGLDLGRVGVPGLTGRVSATGQVEVAGSGVTWSGQLALAEARWGDSPLGLRASVSGDATRVAVRNLNLSVNPVRLSDGSLDADLATGGWKAGAGVGIRLGSGDWTSAWAASGVWGPAAGTFQLKAVENRWSKKSLGDWNLTGAWDDRGWNAGLGDRGLAAEGTSDGRFRVVARAPLPIAGQLTGTWKDGAVTAVVQGFQADVMLASEFVNSPPFSITGGTVTGAFTVEGTPLDPEVNGNLLFQKLRAKSSFVRQPLGPVDVPVVLEGHRVTIAPVNVGPAGRSWMVSGAARLDHLLPEEYQLSVQIDPLSEMPVDYQMTGIAAHGNVTGLLVIRGTPLAVSLGGRLVLQDTTVTVKESAPSSEVTGLGFNADLTLVTGRKVEFLWPNESLPLLRAVGAPNQTLAIKANDVASTWSVVGTLVLRTGEINYLSRTFVIKEGQLGFQESQAGFDPRINVRAEWRYRETSGTTIIGLKAEGLLSKFSPRFDATPYKSAEELNQLVGNTLALPSDYTKATSSDTALSLASDVGTTFLLSPFEETVKKNFNLDLFTVKTEILKKTLLGRNAPVEAADYLDNTRLFFGKYVGDDLFLQGTLAFRQDDTVAGQANPKMVVEPEFQMEFQTPFFLLNWTLLPQHPESLFVTDNTVTFRWKWSY